MASSSLDTYLVVGGEGFLGHALLEALHGRYGSSAKLYSASRTRRFHSEHWSWIKCDLTSVDSIRDVLRETGAKTVFLAAASHFESSKQEAYKVNVQGTRAIIEACRAAGVRRLVYTSSTSVIFDGGDLIDVDETHPRVPEAKHRSHYAASKALGEEIVMEANGQKGLFTTSIRPGGIFGPGDTTAIPQMVQIIRNRQAWVQIGPNNNLCDFDYVDNIALGHLLACEKLLDPSDPSKPGPAAGEIFHITNDEPLPIFDFARKLWYEYNGYKAWFNLVIPLWLGLILGWLNEMLFRLFGRKATGFTRDTVIYATAWRWHNIDKAKRVLGYKPTISVDEGLKRSFEWYRNEEKKLR